ncbi:flavodoxin domain-containing protein [Streptomyces sp. NPDC001970]
MTTKRVLVAHGSTHGATVGIADEIGRAVGDDGYETAVLPARYVRDVSGYDAVMLGSSLHARHWHRDARRCAERNAEALRERPGRLFSSGPVDSTAEQGDVPPVPGARCPVPPR